MMGFKRKVRKVLLGTRVRDVADHDVPEEAVIEADEQELFTVPEAVQAVPSTGLIDEE